MINQASNNQLKLLRKLARRKYREQERRFFVEGVRAVDQVFRHQLIGVDALFIDAAYTEDEAVSGLIARNESATFEIESGVFREISDTENPQGVLALCIMPDEIRTPDLADQEGIIIATGAIQDPGNLGTIIRTAAWFDAKALLLGKGTVDVYNPKVVRSTAGATGALPVCSGDLDQLLKDLEAAGWKVLLLDGNPGAVSLTNVEAHGKYVIVVGNEANGIDPSLISADRNRVMIPSWQSGNYVESLNAAVALSIALWSVHK